MDKEIIHTIVTTLIPHNTTTPVPVSIHGDAEEYSKS
jgi:hypothetical protein